MHEKIPGIPTIDMHLEDLTDTANVLEGLSKILVNAAEDLRTVAKDGEGRTLGLLRIRPILFAIGVLKTASMITEKVEPDAILEDSYQRALAVLSKIIRTGKPINEPPGNN